MLKALRRVSMTNVAYVLFLLVFVALGTFVYALAAQSALAWIIGAVLVVLMAATVVGFRVGARTRAESNDSRIEIPGENIWARPLRREQIDRYLLSYRGVQGGGAQKLPVISAVAAEPTRLMDRHAA
jgi:apolipoprotein N-acyltransferase